MLGDQPLDQPFGNDLAALVGPRCLFGRRRAGLIRRTAIALTMSAVASFPEPQLQSRQDEPILKTEKLVKIYDTATGELVAADAVRPGDVERPGHVEIGKDHERASDVVYMGERADLVHEELHRGCRRAQCVEHHTHRRAVGVAVEQRGPHDESARRH